jgi:hypothetical protein
MPITFDLEYYWIAVGTILVALAAFWGFRRVRGLFGR